MKQLILLRHAEAVAKVSAGDEGRTLSARGTAQMEPVSRHLATLPRPDLALVSPSARTRETFRLSGLDDVPVRYETGIYDAPPEALLRLVQAAPAEAGTLLAVGHNPGFEDIAHALAGSGEGTALALMRREFPTACVALLAFDAESWNAVAPGTGRLVSFATPASLGFGR